METPLRIVIVGNGIAGITAADTLRTAGFDGDLTLVGDEPHAAYSRPALSKSLLRDDQDLTSHLLPPPTHAATELRGVHATGLDVVARRVMLDDGDELAYDGLVVATGCRARRLGDPREADAPDELTLRSLDDAWQLRSRIAQHPSVVVVGGGPLGMEIASACLDTGCHVTLISQGRPLSMQLGSYLSGVLVAAAQARGLRIVTTAGARLVRAGDSTRVLLDEGVALDAQLTVTAVGDLPNVEWLQASGLLRAGALEVDHQGRVRPGIVAAGDVVTVPTPRGMRRVPIWSAAIEQSRKAATALLGSDAAAHVSQPYFWTEQFGQSVKAVGHLPFEGDPTVLDGDVEEGRALLRWGGTDRAGGAAVAALNYRIPIPRLRRLCDLVPAGESRVPR